MKRRLINQNKVENDQLIEDLYNKYSKGSSGFAYYRGLLYYLYKKYSWLFVIRGTYFIKRLIDITASITIIILTCPIFIITAILIKIDSPGPIIFSQIRVGRWGREFQFYKFRSMVINAEEVKEKLLDKNESKAGVIFKMKEDPRITRMGKIIRKYSIDEMPQIWNVLKGDMSLVGPRPPLPQEVKQYTNEDRVRLDVIPGITCIWQVSGRSDIDFKGQVKLDEEYIRNQSFFNDIKILLKTIPVVLLGKGAY